MAIRQTNVRSDSERLSECERLLRADEYIDIHTSDALDGRFEVVNPVPLTFDSDSFRESVETVAERYGLHVEETESPFRLVVSLV
ncbi:hypothetical protein ACFPYI_07235 [Halomarina salina]|uniref:Halobacterial output domain-containing protein n=1 Tax=Halomarina salina TaxID=1872699 RepID=A0ABD5RL70_9EURY|nr:hypothetical protein [Halomarina salina]